jgi:hypothetical protein
MKFIKILLLLNIIAFFLGCDKNQDAKELSGNIVGFVRLIDENGNIVQDKSGVNVSIEGLNMSANSNVDGWFELADIPAGSYNIIYSKTGYGTYKRFGYQFIGGDVPALLNETTLFEPFNIEIQNIDISFIGNAIEIKVELAEPSSFGCRTFFSDSSNVSNLNYEYISGTYIYIGGFTQFSQNIYLDETPYHLGDKVYLAIYFFNPGDCGYYDYEKGKDIYTSYKKVTNTISLILE